MSDDEVFFPPSGLDKLGDLITPRLHRAFQDGALPETVADYGVLTSTNHWGGTRKTLTLFHRAGETAVDHDLEQVSKKCLDETLETTDQEAVRGKQLPLPGQHFFCSTQRHTGPTDGPGRLHNR
jgi:cell division control protein 6